jgi:hypothetical protein
MAPEQALKEPGKIKTCLVELWGNFEMFLIFCFLS